MSRYLTEFFKSEIYLLSLIILAALLWSCCKNDDHNLDCEPEEVPLYPEKGHQQYGYAIFLKNCNPVEASAFANDRFRIANKKQLEFYFDTYIDPNGPPKQSLFFQGFPYRQGLYEFPFNDDSPLTAQMITIQDDDSELLEDYYTMDSTFNNWFEITYIDTVENTIEGKFESRYIIHSPKNNEENPDIYTITEGEFRTQIVK